MQLLKDFLTKINIFVQSSSLWAHRALWIAWPPVCEPPVCGPWNIGLFGLFGLEGLLGLSGLLRLEGLVKLLGLVGLEDGGCRMLDCGWWIETRSLAHSTLWKDRRIYVMCLNQYNPIQVN